MPLPRPCAYCLRSTVWPSTSRIHFTPDFCSCHSDVQRRQPQNHSWQQHLTGSTDATCTIRFAGIQTSHATTHLGLSYFGLRISCLISHFCVLSPSMVAPVLAVVHSSNLVDPLHISTTNLPVLRCRCSYCSRDRFLLFSCLNLLQLSSACGPLLPRRLTYLG